jgi:diaminopropionate ammonia-lyase
VDAPGLADSLGVGKVWVKDESRRMGLPAFKILGASWAVYRALEQHSGGIGEWGTSKV